MTERNTLIIGGLVGAAAGAAVAFLFFTPRGQAWRREAEGSLDMLAREAERLLSAVDQLRTGVAELRGSVQSGWPRTA